jgi:vanillate/3-O-methylgallate O-demethylase
LREESIHDRQAAGNPVSMLRNSKIGMYVYPVVARNSRTGATNRPPGATAPCCSTKAHHMDEVIVEGPQATEFLSHHGINSFANFDLNRAKHFVPVTPNGHVIGDHIIFREREDKYILVGRAPTSNWLMFAAAWGKWNVRLRYDPRSPSRPEGERVLREHYRFQIQGPDAPKVFEKMNGGPIPDIKFFHVDWINVGSKKVQALRHGMSGAPGLEIWGPYKDKDYIHSTILQAARDAGVNAGAMRQPRLFHQHAGIWLDPVAAAGHLHRRRHAGRLPRLAGCRHVRGGRRHRRVVRVRQHRGLLRQPVRTGL